MSEIPADVMKAATDIAYGAEIGVVVGSLPGAIYIARAILAERERCAVVAENATVTVYYHWDEETARREPIQHRSDIAAAIRGAK